MRSPSPPLVLYIYYSRQAHLSGVGLSPVYFQLLSSVFLLFLAVTTPHEFYLNKYLSFACPSHKGSLWWPHSHSHPGRTPTCPPPRPSMRTEGEIRTRVQAMCRGEGAKESILGPRRLLREGVRGTPDTGLLYCLSRLLSACQCPAKAQPAPPRPRAGPPAPALAREHPRRARLGPVLLQLLSLCFLDQVAHNLASVLRPSHWVLSSV